MVQNKKSDEKKSNVGSVFKWVFIVLFLVMLGLVSLVIAGVALLFVEVDGTELIGDANVAIIKVHGVITAESSSSFGSSSGAASSSIVKLIDKADENPLIEAVLFEVNSPGGSPVASEEISNRINKMDKPSVALIREVGASGAYWVSTATDHIVASKMSLTGSIGVIGSYVELYGFLDRYNLSYNRLVAGKHKDLGTPLKEMPEDEREIIQDVLDELHDEFISTVAENRNMSDFEVRKLATGQYYTGRQALENGLVDRLGGMDEALEYIEVELNITAKPAAFEEPRSFWESLAVIFTEQSFFVGKGIGDSLLENKARSDFKVSI
ncbi:signal peptide peptidase SppA [Candidatus Woesearchaeota archaeon]|jgi:protease IV|nr:signal peptide peptidase SppA [Candidatus Woesearchaeota archaeon]MBT3536987.1 signal peptide peptidase SppA [Candidatus Woesearchaeota archaeon]MBT4697597.1 signal peptide peptidase SppA [Candidatus Woesearchaeota archaeon]MBT4717711.1 signal peptide peptidase SppA [Candidatus Woesearchaeota archaeon]MBT7106703.1 signal peptide peptidase SppA [Candidatus Woesearchaeota archaeon]